MKFIELATDRYSVRDFADTPVEQEKLDIILKAAQVAPTAVNNQPQKLYVIRSKEAMDRLTAIKPLYGAPMAIIICYDDRISWKNARSGNHEGGEVDCAIVTTHMMLQAWELGIGSCWIGAFSFDDVAREFGIPANEHPVAILPLGYPSKDCKPSDRHLKYRALEEFVKTF